MEFYASKNPSKLDVEEWTTILCFFPVAARFYLHYFRCIFTLLPVICMLPLKRHVSADWIFRYFRFSCKFWLNTENVGKKRARTRALAHSQQSNGRLKIKRYNEYEVGTEIWLEMGRTTNELQKYKVSREKKSMILSPSFSLLTLFAVFLVLFCFFHFWWNTFNNWPNHNSHDRSEKTAKN